MNGVSQDAFDPTGTLTEAQRLVIGTRLHALLHGGTVEAAAPGETRRLPAARYYLSVEKIPGKAPEDFAEFAGNVSNRITFAYQLSGPPRRRTCPPSMRCPSCRISTMR
ncbi:MAG: hypothetical protein V8R40_12655 [Dysosmobacter sp.]